MSRLAHKTKITLPIIFTIALDAPSEIERVLGKSEEEQAVGFLLWTLPRLL